MRTFLTLDQRQFQAETDISRRPGYTIRRAVRAVVRDDEGAVALLYSRKWNYYKLPGGGMEDGESFHGALERELEEELGCQAKVTGEIGKVIEWRDYWDLQQVSFCYTADVVGKKGVPSFTQSEIDEGFEVVWAPDIDSAIALVESAESTDLPVSFMTRRDGAILMASWQLQAERS